MVRYLSQDSSENVYGQGKTTIPATYLLAVAGMFIIFPNCTLNANCEDLIFNTPDTSYCSKSNFASEGCIAIVMNYNFINFIQWRQEESCSMKQDSA